MDTEKIFTKIKELGHINSKREELREYFKLHVDQVIKLLPRRILNSDGADVLDCLFNGLPDSSNSIKIKVKITDIVLQSMRKESTSLTHCGDVISRLCLELPRLPPDDLVRWSNDSVQSILEDADVNMIWRDVLPECLNALLSYNTIKHCGTELTTVEYKQQCVHTLCQCQWKEKQLVQLAAMFKDMQLPRNDHKQVVNKICSYIIEFPPETIPPLLHQLLKLCKSYHVDIVLSHLSHFFSVRVYSKLRPPPQDSEESTMDVDDIVPHSPAELSRCLSTCLYHLTQGAAEPEAVRRHVRAWPKTQLLRAPFLVDLALALSDKGADFRSVCLDTIKAAIEQRVMDESRSKESVWARSILPPDVDVASLLKMLTTESANHRQLTVMGLINLAFSLLSVSRKPSAAACWSHGKLVLVRLCKAQPETAPYILSQLADRLATNQHPQYAECLHILCALSPISVERCSQLTAILDSCQPAGDLARAAAVLHAVHPLITFSTRTRDALVMVCRKGLYSRDSMHRCLALSGFLTVLRHVKLSRSFTSSQSGSEQYSAHSYLTQLTRDQLSTTQVTSRVRNEAMCLEIVSILRRCLVQDAAVKQLLYTKIFDCSYEKPVLHESILELLYEHLGKYLPDDDDTTPLLLDKCVNTTATGAVLVEPIAHLLYVVAKFIQPSEEELEDILGSQNAESGVYLKSKLNMVMDKICSSNNFGRISMDDPGLSDLTPESRAKSLKVQQILQSYEALIAHQIMQWTPVSENTADTVYELFKACSQLLEQTKTTKLGKKSSKTTLNETRETQKSQKTQKDKGKAPVKASSLVKDRAGPFKSLPCVWDLSFCLRVVELLYSESVPWCSLDQRNELRSKRDFHVWCLRNIVSALNEHADKKNAKKVAEIAHVVYIRCICRFKEMCEFDDQTTLGCIEVFKECVSMLFSTTHNIKMETFLPTITAIPDSSAGSIAAILSAIHAALAQVSADSAEESDLLQKKLTAALVQTANVVLEVPVTSSPEIRAVIIKLQDFLRSSKQDCLALLPSLLAAGCREHQESQFLDDVIHKLTFALGRIDEEDTSSGGVESPDFPAIDSRTGHAVIGHVCTHLHQRYKCVEHMLQRAKDLATAVPNAVPANKMRIESELRCVYRGVCVALCALCGPVRGACSARAGARALPAARGLYAVLARLAAALDPDTADHIRFERLLKLTGKKLSTVTDNLITYLEASQQQQSAHKVLRETRLIPRLVLEAEQFSKHVLLLANKGKRDYQQYLSLGTARDFRIKAPVLEEVLRGPAIDDDVTMHEAETVLPSSPHGSESEEEHSDNDTSRRKRKKAD